MYEYIKRTSNLLDCSLELFISTNVELPVSLIGLAFLNFHSRPVLRTWIVLQESLLTISFKTICPRAGEMTLFEALNGYTLDAASVCKLLQGIYGTGVKVLRERKLCLLPRLSWYPWLPAHSCEGKHLWHLFFY